MRAFYFMRSNSYLSADQILPCVSNLIQGSSAANTLISGLGDDLLQGVSGERHSLLCHGIRQPGR